MAGPRVHGAGGGKPLAAAPGGGPVLDVGPGELSVGVLERAEGCGVAELAGVVAVATAGRGPVWIGLARVGAAAPVPVVARALPRVVKLPSGLVCGVLLGLVAVEPPVGLRLVVTVTAAVEVDSTT